MKPLSEYFAVDLSRRPANASKRGALTRAFAQAAESVINRALEEGTPDGVLIMVTLARAPTPDEVQAAKSGATCDCKASTPPCATPTASRFLPSLCTTCEHDMACHAEVTS